MAEGTKQRIHVNYHQSPVTYSPTCKCRVKVSVPQPSLGAAQVRCKEHRERTGCSR